MKNFLMPIAAAVLGLGICVGLFVHAMGDSNSPAAAAAMQASTQVPPPDPSRVKVCRDLLKSAPRGSVRSYQRDGEIGTVVVSPAYYAADFEAKEALDSTMRCILSEGRKENAGIDYVEYLDAYTHKPIAKWSKYTGLSVE